MVTTVLSAKQLLPSFVSVVGRAAATMPVQPLKAELPKSVHLLKSTDVKEVQPLKAELPIFVQLLKSTVVSAVQLLNA